MFSPSRTRPSALLSERLLVSKLVTCLALAVLLIVGAWSATHADPAVAEPDAAGVTVFSDQAVTTEPGGTSVAAALDTIAVGTVSCLLGVFCGFVIFSLIRLFALHHRSRLLRTLSRVATPHKDPGRPHRPVLTLVELSLSRT